MLSVVLDSSVLVAAFLSRGGPNDQVLQAGGHAYHLYLAEAILDEVRRVLLTYSRIRKKYPYDDQDVHDYIRSLRAASLTVFRKLPEVEAIPDDPKDNIILACAQKAQADYIVSKDRHLNDLSVYQEIPIVGTEAFLDLLSSDSEAQSQ
ncbi:MAG: putative toxin-antitoxin system toxin component, PIN family [Candidatus Bipolaricaulia bacterium]